MPGTRNAGGHTGRVWLRLLLVPLLLFGFTTMHTLGHAAESGHGGGNHTASVSISGHNAAPWTDQNDPSADAALPDLDPTDMCPTVGGTVPAHPGAATTVVTPWPQAPPRPAPPVRSCDPSAVQGENKPSLAALQVLRV